MTWYRSAAAATALVISLLPSVAVGDEVVPATTSSVSTPPDLMVVGDSLSATARYNQDGSDGKIKAWWARLGFASIKVDAVAGSGMLSRGTITDQTGAACGSGRTFLERIDQIDLTAKALIIEGGRNDFKRCVDGEVTRATTYVATQAIKTYMAALRAKIDESDTLTADKVYVMAPWGSTFTSQRSKIAPIIEQYAKAYGFHWIMLPALRDSETVDRTHPNKAGARRIAEQVLANSNIDGTRASMGISVSCTGVSACLRQSSRYAKPSYREAIDRRYWSQPRGPRSYVAYRLTHGGRVTKRPAGASVPATWKDAVVKARGMATSRPSVGSIAWWPAGVIGSRGHLAYVEQVSSDASKVWVSEIVGTRTYRRTSYSASSFPRAFLRFDKSSGSPFGKLTGAVSPRHHRLAVEGYASDPDAYAKGVKIIFKVTQGSRTRTFQVSGRPKFSFAKTLRIRSGRATVRAWAYNAPGSKGASKVYLGGKRVRVT